MRLAGFLLLAALLLGAIAWHRPPEYDEAYSIFLTAGHARPLWPNGIFTPAAVRALYSGNPSLTAISGALKSGDVHPPLYFWGLKLWREVFGPSWFTARLLSVAFALASLALVARLATALEIPVLPALSLTLLSYGFAYTSIIARGFATAQCLNLLGVALALHAARKSNRPLALAAGLALGAASFTNYLAIFTAAAILLWLTQNHRRLLLPTVLGLTSFLTLDAPYFLAQKSSRLGQFTAFSLPHALALLAKDSAAALFGGLPLYAGPAEPAVAAAILTLALTCLATLRRPNLLLSLCTLAPPCGLLALGLIFNNTPIEIRYLTFSIPYLALLLAAALPRPLLALTLAVQCCAIAGLALAPATAQPQALAAAQAASQNALILVPFGNDGVGVPGPFIAALPDTARVELLRPGALPDFTHTPSIVLAKLSPDDSSRATTAQALAYFNANKCFAPGAETALTEVFLNRCADQQR
jgi:hypothetical protein